MSRPPLTRDLRGRLVVLGTGTSVGVPAIGCDCPVCTSDDPRNQRTRCAVVWGLPQGNLLIDTPPDLRQQLLRERIGVIHAVAFTHEHADHLFGLDDLRLMQFYLRGPVPIYCEPRVEQRIRKSFDYAFADSRDLHSGATPKLEFRTIGLEPFAALGATVRPIRLEHGPRTSVLGFRVGNVAYCTDVNAISEASMDELAGLEVLILDCLRRAPHATHFSLAESLDVIAQLRPRQAYLTHLSHDFDHAATNGELRAGVELAYDGLEIPLV